MVGHSWRPATKKVYTTYLKKWDKYCGNNDYDSIDPDKTNVTDFLVDMIHAGSKYKTVNLARCALSAALPGQTEGTLGKEGMVCRVVKAANNWNPSEAKYNRFWDVGLVFSLFRNWGENTGLNRFELTLKTNMLLLLLTAQRGQTIWRLNISGLEIARDKLVFRLKHLLKHNRPGDPLDTLVVPAYPKDKVLCPLEVVKEYVKRTEKGRKGADQLLLITKPPFTPATRDTLSSWTKKTLMLAGINTNYFKAHSTRGAVTSKAKDLGIDTNVLLKQACWKSEETYGKYYHKKIESVEDTLAHTVLKEADKGLKGKKQKRVSRL